MKVKGRDYIDDDTRFGCLAYGIIPGRTRTDVSAESVACNDAARAADLRATIATACADNGLYDLTSGRMLRGEEAASAILDMHPIGRD